MATLFCGRCHVTDLQVFVNGILTDPEGWTQATVSGHPMCNKRLCPSCTRVVRKVLDGARLAAEPIDPSVAVIAEHVAVAIGEVSS